MHSQRPHNATHLATVSPQPHHPAAAIQEAKQVTRASHKAIKPRSRATQCHTVGDVTATHPAAATQEAIKTWLLRLVSPEQQLKDADVPKAPHILGPQYIIADLQALGLCMMGQGGRWGQDGAGQGGVWLGQCHN